MAFALRRHNHPAAFLPPPPLLRRKPIRRRVPLTKNLATIPATIRHRQAKAAKPLPPPRGKTKRRRLPAPYLPTVPGTLHRRVLKASKVPPPQAGRVKRRRVPGMLQSSEPYLAPRRRQQRQQPRPLPPKGSRRHGRVPGTGLNPLAFVAPKRRTIRRLPQIPTAPGKSRRRRVPHTLDPARFALRRRPTVATHQPPLQGGKKRRGRVPGSGLNPLAFVVPKRRQAKRSVLPPFAGKRRRGRVPGSGLAAGPMLWARRRGPKLPKPATPQGARRHRGRVPGSGRNANPVAPRRAKRGRLPEWLFAARQRRTRPKPGQGRGSAVTGPYWIPQAGIFVAGAAGPVRNQSRANAMYVAVGGVVPAGGTVVLLARIVGANGLPITQATLAAIGYVVTDLVSGLQTAAGSFSAGATVFNSLQQADPRWPFDSQYAPGPDGNWGYNFAASLPAFPLAAASPVPEGYPPLPNRDYEIDVLFTAADGSTIKQQWRVSVAPTFG